MREHSPEWLEAEITALAGRLGNEARRRVREQLQSTAIAVSAAVNGGEAADRWRDLVEELEEEYVPEGSEPAEPVEMTAEDRRLAVMSLVGVASGPSSAPGGVTFERVNVSGDTNG